MERMSGNSGGDDREKEREKAEVDWVRQTEETQREREEIENEEVAFASLPDFDQWSMGN